MSYSLLVTLGEMSVTEVLVSEEATGHDRYTYIQKLHHCNDVHVMLVEL